MKTKQLVVIVSCLVAVVAAVLVLSAMKVPAPILTPEVRMIEGAIATLDLKSPLQRVSLETADHRIVSLALDPHDTVVLLGTQVATVGELAQGQRVKAYFTTRNGEEVATSIVVRTPKLQFPRQEQSTPRHQAATTTP